LEALGVLAEKGQQVVITYPNNDAGGRLIIDKIRAFENENHPSVSVRQSLGRYLLHGVLNTIGRVGGGAFAGNSSSGIKETPVFGVPVVNIGPRQSGRLRGVNVIDVGYDSKAILEAVNRCIDDEELRAGCRNGSNPYGNNRVGPQIAEVLATVPIDARLLQKKMTF
jgi:UDP-N-acetylglucosamine 2-epimerase